MTLLNGEVEMQDGEQREILLQINQSGYFDEAWFAKKYALELRKSKLPPLVHFVMNGAKQNLDPGPRFSTEAYIKENPGVKDSRTIPLIHFLKRESAFTKDSYCPSRLDLKKVYIRKSFLPPSLSEEELEEALQETTAVILTIFKKPELLKEMLAFLDASIKEVILIDNRLSKDQEATEFFDPFKKAILKIKEEPISFNWSRLNNLGALEASGKFLLFLNDDLSFGDQEALSQNGTTKESTARKFFKPLFETLLSPTPQVKIVAPLLLNPDGTVQSSGTYRLARGVTVGHALITGLREPCLVEGLTGAFLLTRKKTWQENPFDEEQKILLGDSLFCFQNGNNALDPRVSIKHFERSSRGADPSSSEDLDSFLKKMPLQKESLYVSPLLEESKVKRALFLKLDHIGDFSIALEAIRDFSILYPSIPLDIACGPWNHTLAKASGLFSRILDITFFTEKSTGGIDSYSPEAQAVLIAAFTEAPWTFVIDLRAHAESRIFFRLFEASSAITVGYQSPYGPCDISLAYRASRKTLGEEHNVVDLKWLLAAVPIFKDSKKKEAFPEARKVITFSISASTPAKTWPVEKWKELLRLLQEAGFSVYQIGSKKDQLLVPEIQDKREVTGLAEIGKLAKNLGYAHLGHDTGPTHIIAQEDHPVLEIISGLVDPAEWQGRGPDVISIYHRMHCTPCYDQRCPRNFRCLLDLEPLQVFLALKKLFWDAYSVQF